MIRAAIFATLALSAPVAAQEAAKPTWATLYPEASACLTSKGTALAESSKESAETVAQVVVFDCAQSDEKIGNQIGGWRSANLWTLSMIVRVRAGG